MCDESIQAEQQSRSENRNTVVKTLAQSSSADGHGAIRKSPDHDGVDDSHTHPANFGEDEGPCEMKSSAHLL
jgi:hypothetical protein